MRKTRLSNGIKIVTDTLPERRMVQIQFHYGVGSGVETPAEWGAAHYLEHLFFSGTESCTPYEFVCRMAEYGAIMNASTRMDHTDFFLTVPQEGYVPVLCLFMELLTHAPLQAERVELERDVILGEWESVRNDPKERGVELFYQAMVGEYGHPIIGTKESLHQLNAESLQQFRSRFYTPDHLVIGIAGPVEHERVVEVVERCLGHVQGKHEAIAQPFLVPSRGDLHVPLDSDVMQVFLGLEAPGRADKKRHAYAVMQRILFGDGADMWVRMFHRIRTQLSLCYEIGGEYMFLGPLGFSALFAETRPESVPVLLGAVQEEMDSFLQGFTKQEMHRGFASLRTEWLIAEETLDEKVNRMILRDEYQAGSTFQEELDALERVTVDDVLAVAEEYLRPEKIRMLTIGPEEA